MRSARAARFPASSARAAAREDMAPACAPCAQPRFGARYTGWHVEEGSPHTRARDKISRMAPSAAGGQDWPTQWETKVCPITRSLMRIARASRSGCAKRTSPASSSRRRRKFQDETEPVTKTEQAAAPLTDNQRWWFAGGAVVFLCSSRLLWRSCFEATASGSKGGTPVVSAQLTLPTVPSISLKGRCAHHLRAWHRARSWCRRRPKPSRQLMRW